MYVPPSACSACNYGSSCQHCWAGWVRAERASLRRHTAVSTYNAPSSGSISSQHLLCYATPQEKSETNTTKVDERWNCSVHLSWNPAVDSPNSWVAPLELIWVVTLITQSTDVPYITTWIVYCISEWRQIISYSWGECVEKSVFFPFIQGLPHKNQFNDIVNVLGIFPPKPDTLFFLQLCSFTRLLNGNAGTLDASFLITCGSWTRSKKANTTHQCVHSRASSSPVRQPCNKCFVMLIMQIFCCVEEVSTLLLLLMLDCNAKCRAAINLALLL